MASDNPAIEMMIEPRTRRVGAGTVRRLLPYRSRRMVGPFIFLDLIGPERLDAGEGLDIDAHPHIGLSTLTYLLRGRMVHRDSTGAVQTIDAGAVNWMTAGEGVTHTERSHPDDRAEANDVFGAQIWVALPEAAEEAAPRFQHCAAADVPEETGGGTRVRVAAGVGWSLEAPVRGSSPLVLAEADLRDSTLAIPDEHPERAVVVLDGRLQLNDHDVPAGTLAVLDPGGRPSLSGTGTALVLGGEPVGSRHIWWNFVHSDPDLIEDAKQRWREQRFPKVPADHDVYVPLPE